MIMCKNVYIFAIDRIAASTQNLFLFEFYFIFLKYKKTFSLINFYFVHVRKTGGRPRLKSDFGQLCSSNCIEIFRYALQNRRSFQLKQIVYWSEMDTHINFLRVNLRKTNSSWTYVHYLQEREILNNYITIIIIAPSQVFVRLIIPIIPATTASIKKTVIYWH